MFDFFSSKSAPAAAAVSEATCEGLSVGPVAFAVSGGVALVLAINMRRLAKQRFKTACERCFREVDADRSGLVSKEEWARRRAALEAGPSEEVEAAEAAAEKPAKEKKKKKKGGGGLSFAFDEEGEDPDGAGAIDPPKKKKKLDDAAASAADAGRAADAAGAPSAACLREKRPPIFMAKAVDALWEICGSVVFAHSLTASRF